jgi:hypothetical protein
VRATVLVRRSTSEIARCFAKGLTAIKRVVLILVTARRCPNGPVSESLPAFPCLGCFTVMHRGSELCPVIHLQFVEDVG